MPMPLPYQKLFITLTSLLSLPLFPTTLPYHSSLPLFPTTLPYHSSLPLFPTTFPLIPPLPPAYNRLDSPFMSPFHVLSLIVLFRKHCAYRLAIICIGPPNRLVHLVPIGVLCWSRGK
ncbi:hypothetical protein GQ43DRAFT_129103 [Delitschia confertaspora ATCC 74209]|uniref:Uncharacterized protein n=1 Tax=Delitschia confertaspora ATCC 74209 TaxID=1513339 RepID=A0A9P4MW38_9PLEO|nr:hypothetical protein GQ43DRAFT_129103 [Delitschia confertaspora ATCC 74209]